MKQHIRFDGEAPRRRAHSSDGIEAMALLGSPPPRIVIGSLSRQVRDRAPKLYVYTPLNQLAQAAGRSMTPAGISPVVTMRQRAISSFRASATIMVVLRLAGGTLGPCRYHCASPLSFWKLRNRQASWIRPRRTRALPALAKPLLAAFRAALIGGSCHAGVARHRSAISQVPRQIS